MEQLEKDGLSTKHIIISDRAQMLMPYHQYQDELEDVMNIVKEGMEHAVSMEVELKAEGTYAKNWYELK